MKKKVSFLITLWWVVILAGAGVLLLIVSEKESTVSSAENRYLQGFPEVSAQSLTSGDFMSEFEAFLCRMPFSGATAWWALRTASWTASIC